jgi:hypothetical protein
MHEGLDDNQLLFHALGVSPGLFFEIQCQSLLKFFEPYVTFLMKAGHEPQVFLAAHAIIKHYVPGDVARPRVGCRRSSRRRIVVVLPAPLGPKKPNISPWYTSRSRFCMPLVLP